MVSFIRFRLLVWIISSCILVNNVAYQLKPFVSLKNSQCTHSYRRDTSQLRATPKKVEDLLYNPPTYMVKLASSSPNQRLTLSDAVLATGQSLNTVRRDMIALATASGAKLEVTDNGEILYTYPKNIDSILSRRLISYRVKQLLNLILPILQAIYKASFGIILILSLTILMAVFSQAVTSARRNRRHGHSESREKKERSRTTVAVHIDGQYLVDIWRSVFRFVTYKQKHLDFFEAVFSILFGDGDPTNLELPDKLAQEAASMIRSNEGIVTAEQLAPYVSTPPPLPSTLLTNTTTTAAAAAEDITTSPSWIVDESYVLPLVMRFGGYPIVTDQGDILYKFEDLMDPEWLRTTHSSNQFQPVISQSSKEKLIPFTKASTGQVICIAILFALNFWGTIQLHMHLQSMKWLRYIRLGMFSDVTTLPSRLLLVYPIMIFYAFGFVTLPVWRYWQYRKERQVIQENIQRRTHWYEVLQRPVDYLAEKLRHRTQYLLDEQVQLITKKLSQQQSNTIASPSIGKIIYSTHQQRHHPSPDDDE